MTMRDDLAERMKDIERRVVELEGGNDPVLKVAARELISAVMELHQAAIGQMLQIVREGPSSEADFIGRFAGDEVVGAVLLLHGLHPLDLQARVKEALRSAESYLKSHGATAELVSVSNEGLVVNLRGQAKGCGSTLSALRARLESDLQNAAPEASLIVVNEVNDPFLDGFVPLTSLRNGDAVSALSRPAQNARGV